MKEMDEDLCNKEASKRKCSLWELIEIDVKEKKKIHGDRKNECNQCEYTPSNTDSLRIHLMTHSGEKSNKCNQCDFASSRAASLRDTASVWGQLQHICQYLNVYNICLCMT